MEYLAGSGQLPGQASQYGAPQGYQRAQQYAAALQQQPGLQQVRFLLLLRPLAGTHLLLGGQKPLLKFLRKVSLLWLCLIYPRTVVCVMQMLAQIVMCRLLADDVCRAARADG
jgi:hypothetical protein